MKHSFSLLMLFLAVSLAVNAQDKTVKAVLEMGRTDNRTMEHADYIARNIGGRLVGTHMLHHAEDWVVQQFRSWGLEVTVQEAVEIGVGFDRGPWSGLHRGHPRSPEGTRAAGA